MRIVNNVDEWPSFLMVVGLPGSGKSTYIKNHFNENLRVHSSDAIREELSGDVNNQKINNKVFELLHKRVKEDLQNGISCVYDATNLNWKKRKAFLESLAGINCFKICHIIATPYEVCLEQNRQRDRVVPESVIERMYMNFDIPFYDEGWNGIEIIYTDVNYSNAYGTVEQFLRDTKSFNQDSKWHSDTLGGHCSKCLDYVKNNANKHMFIYPETLIAAALHDCGKPFTQTYTDTKGQESDFAHYYHHENVGCYNSLFYSTEDYVEKPDKLVIAAMIRWHMALHFFKDWSQKTISRYENKFTSHRYLKEMNFYDALKSLHEGDKAAH